MAEEPKNEKGGKGKASTVATPVPSKPSWYRGPGAIFINAIPSGMPRNLTVGIFLALVAVICFVVVGSIGGVFSRGGSSPSAIPSAAATLQPTGQAAATAGTNTGEVVGVDGNPGANTMSGGVLAVGDLKLTISNQIGATEFSVDSPEGNFMIGDQSIGSVRAAEGGKVLNFNGNGAVSVKLFKVDPTLNLPPVTFYMGTRKFEALAQLDGQYQLVIYDDAGQPKPAIIVDPKTDVEGGVGLMNMPVVAVAENGDSLLFTFAAVATSPDAMSTPVQ